MNIFEKEIIRRIKELDCKAIYRDGNGSISVTYDSVHIAEIKGGEINGTALLAEEEHEKYLHVKRLCANVSNYCTAYENGEPIKDPNFSDGYRIIYRVGSAKMAARYDRKSGFEFVVWNGDENPDFFVNYDKARERFAILSGLVDRERIFEDEELEALYYCVYVISEMNDTLNKDMTELVNNLAHKLDIAISKNLSAERTEKYASAV